MMMVMIIWYVTLLLLLAVHMCHVSCVSISEMQCKVDKYSNINICYPLEKLCVRVVSRTGKLGRACC